ncbi:class III lanthionine synthetase LanKC [Xanthomonas campestris pv. phormiicola]|nr:class III lanthionine synthetase LanKC [Xanthomonas campestris pv. phormiicola]UYC18414.1 class III lanthionine synthetase LanKC [Xanthomonas campestris pv. phormiicola]
MSGRARSLREARHIDKVFFMAADSRFYEPVYSHYRPTDELSSLVKRILRARGLQWSVWRSGVWSHVMPSADAAAAPLATQGWKIHVSANEVNCRDILAKVADLALEHGLQFKFANDINTMKLMTSKRWSRGGSGKFITLYPPTDEVFCQFIECAYAILKDDVGSYILSDNRYRDCRCLYYRYGGIIPVNRLDYMGQLIPILTSPDGEEVVDRRTPYFETPPWVSDPFPRDDAEQPDMTLNEGRFVITSALGFSNTGGVYLATDTASGREVVVKEARPYVELVANGQDATTRLAQEEKVLRMVSDLGVSPQLVTTFWDWENFYLVEEHLDAVDMREVMLMNTPLLRIHPGREDSEAFYVKCKSIFTSLLEAVDRFHHRGLVIGDLSPMNILVDKASMTVRIIDLEAAFQPAVDDALDIHTPGFRAAVKGRKQESNSQDDIYAIGAIMMYSMFPIVAMAYVRDDLFSNVLPALVADIGWSNTPIQKVIRRLSSNTISCREAIALLDGPASFETPYTARHSAPILSPGEACRELAAFIVSHYRLEEVYALFPVDPFAGHTNALSLGFGACGIVQALLKCGFEVPGQALDRYHRELAAVAAETLPPGLLTGSAGIAWASLAIGSAEIGRRFMGYANGSALLRRHHSLYYGMAGVGMANLAAYRNSGEPHYLDVAIDLAKTLASTAIEDAKGLHWEDEGGIRIGFGYGQSGVALFFLRLSQVLNVASWRELGGKALDYDLSFGFELEPGSLAFACAPEEKNTYEHYIEQGSAGVAKVAIRYGRWDQLGPILTDLHRKYSGFPGLIYGLAGFVDVLVDAHLYSGDERYLAMAERPLQGLADLYLFKEDSGYATPGENLFRISCDYATGTAGIMRTLHRRATLAADEFCLDEIDDLPAKTRPALSATHPERLESDMGLSAAAASR